MTKLAWALSLAAQVALVLSYVRNQEYTLWLYYLVGGILRSAILWPLDGMAYFWAWAGTEPVMLILQVAAVRESVEDCSPEWPRVGAWLATGMFVWSVVLTAVDWPTGRRAALMLRQAGAYGCAGWLSGAWIGGCPRPWLLAYFGLQSLSAILAQVALTRSGVALVNTVHLAAVAVLFSVWTARKYREGACRNAG